jgi:hypothetical protein
MVRSLLLLLSVAMLFAADDPWKKVQDLKSGTELQVYREGSAKPLEAKLDEARDDVLVVVIKKEQTAIPKSEINRIDYRPTGRTVTKETKQTTGTVTAGPPPAGMDHGPDVPGNGWSSGISVSKPGFENIYMRRSPAPKPAPKQ